MTADKTEKQDRATRAPRAPVSPVAREIDENLKRVYQAALTEEVPDRFTQLLAQLRAQEGKP